MKLLIFLCVLVVSMTLSTRGWCASSISPNCTHRVITSGSQSSSGKAAAIISEGSVIGSGNAGVRSGGTAIGFGDPAINGRNSARRAGDEEMRIMLIVCVMAAYLIALVSWTVSAKGSLDRVLKHVIQSMAKY